MGLDIYFEKRKRDFDFSDLEKIRKERNEASDAIGKLIEDNKKLLVNDLLAFKVLDEKRNGENLDAYSAEVLKVIDQLDELDATYHECERKIEELNPRKEVAYFRKVNLLMVFFNYEGNCEYKQIYRSEIEELIDRCKQVLDNHELAEELLPTTSGFFFGSTDYDEYYFEDVKAVLDTFTNIYEETDWGTEVVEMYCWW